MHPGNRHCPSRFSKKRHKAVEIFLVVRPFTRDGDDSSETLVAVDTIGAGTGERVLVVVGRAARYAIGRGQDVGCQTAIVGVVDGMELEDGRRIGQLVGQDGP